MSHGPFSVFTVTMPSAGTFSNELDLGRSWKRVYIDPTGAASEVRFVAAAIASSAGGTYRQVYLPQTVSTATVQANIWKIASAVSGGIQDAPAGLRYLKVELTATVANGAALKLICSD